MTTDNTPALPPLPEPDTHCFDDDACKDVWGHSDEAMRAYALQSIAADRAAREEAVLPEEIALCEAEIERLRGLNKVLAEFIADGKKFDDITAMIEGATPPAVSVPAGMALVPSLSTAAMNDAGMGAIRARTKLWQRLKWSDIEAVYLAMLAAAPSPTAGAAEPRPLTDEQLTDGFVRTRFQSEDFFDWFEAGARFAESVAALAPTGDAQGEQANG